MIQILVSYIAALFLYFVGKTSFIDSVDDPEFKFLYRRKKPLIYAFWHNNQVFLAYVHRKEKASVMVSKSKDGEYIAQVMNRLGLIPVRGSSSKGGDAALRQMVECLEKGEQVGFSPDGPRGPVYSVQLGIIYAAQKTGLPVVPVSQSSRREIRFKSWDKFKLPLPFNHFMVVHGKPLSIPSDMDAETAKLRIKNALNETQTQSDEYLIHSKNWMFLFSGELLFILYNSLSLLLSPLILLAIFIKFGLGRSLKGLRERFGFHPFLPTDKKRLWFHSASIGEWRALKPIYNEIKNKSNVDVVVTVTTPEAKRLIEKENPELGVRYLPVDYPWLLKSWIKKINPFSFFIIETELWPNLINVAHKLHVPVFILNGRLSEKSVRGWKKGRPFVGKILNQVTFIFSRTEKDMARFVRLGIPQKRVLVLGNTKADNLSVISLEEKTRQREKFFKNWKGTCLVGVSTWPGEEEMLLKVLQKVSNPAVKLILAPRRQDRMKEVADLVSKFTFSVQFFSEVKNDIPWESRVLLVDTVGDLKDLFIICDLAFVGGSLYPRGGQNPLEPAAARLPLVFGPHMENFENEAAGFLSSEGGRQALTAEEAALKLEELLLNESLRRETSENAAQEVISQQGAAKRTVEELSKHLGL